MPLASRKRKTSEDPDVEIVTKKKVKSGGAVPQMKDDSGNPYWEISGKRRLQVTEFKGKTMVSIREFYEKDGRSLPGKAGINMPVEQFQTFISLLPDLYAVLRQQGHKLDLPHFDPKAKAKARNMDDEDDEGDNEDEEFVEGKKTSRRANFEETSDEDDDA